jgi:hypothetical protein
LVHTSLKAARKGLSDAVKGTDMAGIAQFGGLHAMRNSLN